LVLLDGKTRPEIQKEVDCAKEAKALEAFVDNAAEARFISEAVKEAKANGILGFRWIQLHYCVYTGKSAGYATHCRSGKFHRKGETDYSKPLYLSGVDLANRFVTIKGYATLGCCREFWDSVRPKLAARLEDVMAEIAEEITGHPPRWRRFDNYKCTACGWNGHEGQMLKLPAVMGGFYPGECPSCGAKNLPLGRSVVELVAGEFSLVPVKQERE
jgi:hypothetical protein